jgi:hypothetical protein
MTRTNDLQWGSQSQVIFSLADSPCDNLVVVDNIFTGNPTLTNVTGGSGYVDVADGFLWVQWARNCFAGRNAITNYVVEGIQFNAGPVALAGNVYVTHVSRFATTALNANAIWGAHPANDYTTYFVGNDVTGGRHGQLAINSSTSEKPYRLHFTGNTLNLFPPFSLNADYPGAAVASGRMNLADVAGNTLLAGGHGVRWLNNCSNAFVLKNRFTNATYRALVYDGTNGAVRSVAILKNDLGQGASFHLKVRPEEAGSFFLWRNTYYSSNGITAVNPFVDYPAAPVHFVY